MRGGESAPYLSPPPPTSRNRPRGYSGCCSTPRGAEPDTGARAREGVPGRVLGPRSGSWCGARWERHCWQRGLHEQRRCSSKQPRETGNGSCGMQKARRDVGGRRGAHRREGKGPKRSGLGAGASCQYCNRSPSLLLTLRGYAPSAPWSCQGCPEVRCTRCGRQGAHGHTGRDKRRWGSKPISGGHCENELLGGKETALVPGGSRNYSRLMQERRRLRIRIISNHTKLGLGQSLGSCHLQVRKCTAWVSLPAFYFQHFLQEAYPLPHSKLPLLQAWTSASALVSPSLFSWVWPPLLLKALTKHRSPPPSPWPGSCLLAPLTHRPPSRPALLQLLLDAAPRSFCCLPLLLGTLL